MLQTGDDPSKKIYKSLDPGGNCEVAPKGRRFYVVSPGLSGDANTISLESADWSHHFLSYTSKPISSTFVNGSEYPMYGTTIVNKTASDDPHTFEMRSTWLAMENFHQSRYFSLCPAHMGSDMPTYVVRHVNDSVVLQFYDFSEEFLQCSGYRLIQGDTFLKMLLQLKTTKQNNNALDKD